MSSTRADRRRFDELRPVAIEYDPQPDAAGSLLIRRGNTQGICAVTVEDSAPPFLDEFAALAELAARGIRELLAICWQEQA